MADILTGALPADTSLSTGIGSSGVTVKGQSVEELLRYESSASGLHARTLSRLIARRKLSERSMTRRYDSWNAVDENCRLFIDLTRGAKKGDGTAYTDKKEIPWARSIVVPMSYAIQQVYLTQLLGIFTKRDPALEVYGVGPEDVKPAILMNAVMGYDQTQTNYIMELYTALNDATKYGFAGLTDYWREEFGWKTDRDTGPIGQMRALLGYANSQRTWGRMREYQEIRAADPFNTFPDPRVSLAYVQDGEFIINTLWKSYLDILEGKKENGGNYFNVEAIKFISPRQQKARSRNRFQASQMNLIGSSDERDRGFHAIDCAVIRIIPSDWGLGDGDRPEKWQFAWVDDQVIIRAHPYDYDHQRFNFSGLESNPDTHTFGNQGDIENIDGLQRFMNWKYNSHVQNIIRHLNNRMIYSSALIEAADVENPDAAMHIRLTAQGEQLVREGRMTIDQMIEQLQLQDVTGPMLKDIMFDMDLSMRMSGAADQMMGRTSADKRTLGEISRVGHEGSQRMAMRAMMYDIMGLKPLALRWASNRQQYTSEEQYVRITGAMAAQLGLTPEQANRFRVRQQDLYGNYDYASRTGPEPMDPGEMAQLMMNAVTLIEKQPAILTLPDREGKFLDPHEFIKEGLRNGGVRNVDDFYRQMGGLPGQQPPGTNVQVLPDEQVQQMARAGNVVPMQQPPRMAA